MEPIFVNNQIDHWMKDKPAPKKNMKHVLFTFSGDPPHDPPIKTTASPHEWKVVGLRRLSFQSKKKMDVEKVTLKEKRDVCVCFKDCLFSSLFGEDDPILTSIFFKGVETTN